MARYMQTAAQANETATALVNLITDPKLKPVVAEMAARLVNFGLRCAPRAVQSTVRLNAVQRAVQGLPVKVRMEKRKDDKTGFEYNALVTIPIMPEGEGKPTVDGDSDEGGE